MENYFLSEEQIKFTSHPLDAITKCEDEDDPIPIMIFHNDVPAGFFVLHGWNGVQEYSDNERALLLRAYSIDSKYQGKGIAKESLRLLPSFISEHFINKNEIILAVNHKNFVAQYVYTT
ncbi:MAG: GNAT family N-acetyltransferase, partial [Neobacillus sp.]